MSLPALLVVSHNDLIGQAKETRIQLEKAATLASERKSALASQRKTGMGKSCSNAASVRMSSTSKTTKMTLRE
jgi:hypothetical protein